MENFDQQLLRLKQALGVTSDQDVAAALGLTKAAFSDRKKRGAFPEEKLYALAAKRPELHLDVLHVLVGDKKDAVVRLTIAELEAALAFGADRGGTIAEQLDRAGALVEQMRKPLPDDEQQLLNSYRRCSFEAKADLIQRAALLSSGLPIVDFKRNEAPKADKKKAAAAKSFEGSQQVFHKAPKGGVAGRDIVKGGGKR